MGEGSGRRYRRGEEGVRGCRGGTGRERSRGAGSGGGTDAASKTATAGVQTRSKTGVFLEILAGLCLCPVLFDQHTGMIDVCQTFWSCSTHLME